MHIVLSGYYGFENVGDEAILFSIIQSLKELQHDIKITVLSNDPSSTSKTYGVDAVNRWKIKEVIHVLKDSDGLISGGGSLLQDQTSLKSIPYYTLIMHLAKRCKKPVFIYAQGIGPISHPVSKLITKYTLNKMDSVTVRDNDSKKLLETIGVNKSIDIVPDAVLGLDVTTFKTDWKLQEKNKKSVAVSVREWPSDVPYKQKIAASLDILAQKGFEIVFLPMHGEVDNKASEEVANMMTERSIIAPHDASIEDKITLIGQSRILLGMRLHSLIFSVITRTPFVALSYDPKVDSFASIFEQPVAGNVTQENWDSNSLVDIIEESFSEEANEKNRIHNKLIHYQKEAFETSRKALSLFAKMKKD
ncbi:polysaccharide pyruvyl transferase CsaB [Paraliobacillus salinarum]|uniref:polysaccharide pyruvyl transferase CsaB n=1 Tax=Paraliobacillus salinarum TaxID=1158996 RepID=UPI0015F5CB9B|nr:polysaccharide pyruvyl transferase CsaB [Paraliobacillus salinarum]